MTVLDYSIDIALTHPSVIRVNDNIDLLATPTITHPIGTTPVQTVEWTNHNGDNLGVALGISYSPSEAGYYSVQVSITYEDASQSYIRTISQDVSFYVLEYSSETYTFSSSYLQHRDRAPYSNMDIHRSLSYFPSWSSANKNFYSNTSKLLSPMLETISAKMDDVDSFIENNIFLDDLNHFGYRSNQYEIVTVNNPMLLRTEYGFCENIGEHGQVSLESYPIRTVTFRDPNHFSRQSYTVSGGSDIISIAFPSILYVVNVEASDINPLKVSIRGIDEFGDKIQEEFVLISAVPFETINKFKVILGIDSDREIIISNYIDTSLYHSMDNGINLQKRIANVEGEYFEPLFELDESSLLALNGTEFSRKDEYKFELPYTPSNLFINGLLDVIYLNNNTLYSSKLMLDYYAISSENSSTNNNSFIYLEDINVSEGSDIVAVIDVERIKSEFQSKSIRVSISNGDNIKYVSSDISLVDDSNTWLSLDNAGNRIVLSIPATNTNPYIFELTLNNRSHPFCAMSYMNVLKSYAVAEDIQDMFIYNKELWVHNLDGTYNIIDPIRLCFTTGKNRVYTFNNFNNVELIYDE